MHEVGVACKKSMNVKSDRKKYFFAKLVLHKNLESVQIRSVVTGM